MSKFWRVVALKEMDRRREHEEVREENPGDEQDRRHEHDRERDPFLMWVERGDHERVRLVEQ